MKNHYEILGVSKDTSKEEIRKKYLKLSKIYHPDISSAANAEEKFKEINEAYSILHDNTQREIYDQNLSQEKEQKKEFREQSIKVDIFIKYIKLMKKYRPRKKNIFDVLIQDIFDRFIIVQITDYSMNKIHFKRGSVVSIRAKGVTTYGGTLEEYSAIAMVKVINNLEITLEVLSMKKAKLLKGSKGKLKYEEDTKFLFENIERNMIKIFNNPMKYLNFTSVITAVYSESALSLSKIGLFEPKGEIELKLFNKMLNNEQKELINKSIEMLEHPNGYILACSGPGGTGKTTCIVEIIEQILRIKNDAKILITSFTNVAVDNVFSKLLNLNRDFKGKIIRVAHDQAIKLDEVKKVSITEKTQEGSSKINTINKHNVIGATLDKLGTVLFDDIEFDFAIIDEASMVEFPKFLLAAAKSKKLLLIGDNKQLGPFFDIGVKSYLRKNNFTEEQIEDMQDSFFLKLTKYLWKSKSSTLITLNEQRRSYEQIIKFSNDKFYGGKLRTAYNFPNQYKFLKDSEFDSELTKEVLNPDKKVVWLDLHNLPENLKYSSNKNWTKKYPKKDIRYFNIANASFGLIFIRELLKELHKKFDKNLEYRRKIGIISPYNDQGSLILKYLLKHPEIDPYLKKKLAKEQNDVDKDIFKVEKFLFTDQLEIGTVHKFQGREKDIIIFDITSYTGSRVSQLLKDFRVLNVALTRPRTKLIIIGSILDNQMYYSELYSPKYTSIIGRKQNIDPRKKQMLLLTNKLQGTKYEDIFYDSKDINDYLKEPQLRKEFNFIVRDLCKIEDFMIEQGKGESILSDEEQEENKINQIIEMFDLHNYSKDIKDNQYLEYIKQFIKDQLYTCDFTHKLIQEIRYKLISFKSDIGKLKEMLKLINHESVENRIKKLNSNKKQFPDSSISRYILEIFIRNYEKSFRIELYKQKLSKITGENFDKYDYIFVGSISTSKQTKYIKKIDEIQDKFFKPFGKELCKRLISGKDLLDRNPLDWFESIISSKPEFLETEIWIVLRYTYDLRFGKLAI